MSVEADILNTLRTISQRLDTTNTLLKSIVSEAGSINSNTDYIYNVKNEIEDLHQTVKRMDS